MSWDAVHHVATDRSSGSATIAARAAMAFQEMSETLSTDAITSAAETLVRGQPIMAACLRLVDHVLRALDESGPVGVKRVAEGFEDRLRTESVDLTRELVRRLPDGGTVLTVSASSTVITALGATTGVRVLCAASNPGAEGVRAAERLRAHGVEADVIGDGAVAQQSTRADLIVFGADTIGPRAVLNKTGTLAAALGARASARPCLCVAGSSKIVSDKAWPLLAEQADHLMVEGVPVFEEVPIELTTQLITETGPMSPRALRRAARDADLHERIVQWLSSR